MLIRWSVEAEQLESAPCESNKEIYVEEQGVKYLFCVKAYAIYNCLPLGEGFK